MSDVTSSSLSGAGTMVTSSPGNVTDADLNSNVNDAAFNKDIRIIALYVLITTGTIGGLLVFAWLWHNRRRKSRVNALILHVAVADLFVILGACLIQLIWEHDRNWALGEAVCRIVKFIQSFAMSSSNYMVVVLSLDRHQAIRSPLREPFPVWKMTLTAWLCAAFVSSPQLIVFRTNFISDPSSPFYNMTLCESIWRERPRVERQAYIVFVDVVVFILPFIILVLCYVRIFLKIAEKADEGRSNKKQTIKPGKVHLQSTPSSSLPKAKIKTLKMTVVMVLAFIICGMPYPILELIYSFGDHKNVSAALAAVLGSMAVANSAGNPYVFLLFNANWACLRRVFLALCPCCARRFEPSPSTRSDYTLNRSDYTTMNTEMSRSHISRFGSNQAPVEMSVKNKIAGQKAVKNPSANYTLISGEENGKDAANKNCKL
uniref:Orphan G-protein coupled receptor 27 n=1 Tax=Platynereis dumerilii TaxID=6359 RepID=A0A0K0PUF8_PLADU|nr:orphan G-protein coupled receptor 27 [Platynereis dumerilii]